MLPLPPSSTPFQLPVNVLRLTVAREPSKTVMRARAVLRMVLATGEQADVVHAHVGDVADEQAFSIVARLPCRRSTADPVVWVRLLRKMQFRNEHRVLHLPEVLDRHAAAAGARVVSVDLDLLDRRIRPRVDLDAAAVGVEERRLADVVRFDRRLLARAGGEVVRAGDLEAAQHGLPRHAVAEIDHVVDDGGIAGGAASAISGIRRRQDDIADGLQRDAIVPRVEPDERLSPGGRDGRSPHGRRPSC